MTNATDPTTSKPSKRRGKVVDIYRRTDLGNSERFVADHAEDVRWVSDLGVWIVWSGSHWEEDSDRAVVTRRMGSTVRQMYKRAGEEDGTDTRRALADWASKSEAAPRLRAGIDLASTDPRVRVRVADLDADPMLLGCRNGTLDLVTGQLREPDRADLITRCIPTDFDPDAKAPLWDKMLARIQPDPVMREFLQRAVGYSITGRTDEQVMFIAYGRGANGKSVWIETLMSLLGSLSQKAPSELLMARPVASDLSNDVARLRGSRLVAVVETEENRRLAESKVKELTGGDRVAARFLHREFFEFDPVCKLWLISNHRPRIAGTDDGIWRRLITVPFEERITSAEADKRLGEKLRTELPGILAWAVRGCLDWQSRGDLGMPGRVIESAAEYREEEDTLGGFIAECCEVYERARAAAAALYSTYVDWSKENGHGVVSSTKFGRMLRERGYTSRKTGTKWWQGIALRGRDDHGGDDDQGGGRGPGGGDPEPKPYPPCKVCGEPCHPVITDRIHPNCAPELPIAETENIARDPEPEKAAIADPGSADPAPEERAELRPVLRRLRRPFTEPATVYLTWSSGRGVDQSGAEFRVPAAASLADLLPALPAGTARVIMCGQTPGRTGPGLESWALGALPDGWSASGSHYLDPAAFAGRWEKAGGGVVAVHLLSSWSRSADTKTVRPAQARDAFGLFRSGLAAVFGRERLAPGETVRDGAERAPAILGSPASTGRELLMRTLPARTEWPVLDPEHVELLHRISTQGRIEMLTDQHPDELPGLYSYDARWSYAALCRTVTGTGPAELDTGSAFLMHRPAWYDVEWTVPDGWDHLALLPIAEEGAGSRWAARKPGTRHRAWVSHQDLLLANKRGWPVSEMAIHQRLLLAETKTQPLRTWADKLIELREEWLPAQDATPAVVELARDFTRTTLLAALGALQGRRHRVTRVTHRDDSASVPRGAEVSFVGDQLKWTEERPAAWPEMVHPEWAGQVWAAQRHRLLDNTGAQPGAGALELPYSTLVALRTDAIYATADPGWTDNGRLGQFRPQLALPGPWPTPRSERMFADLRKEG